MVESELSPKVIVVGAGPAGTRCAARLVKAGIRPTVIDEGRQSGGQIYRRQPPNFTRSYHKLYGTEADKAHAIHDSFDSLLPDIDYLPETLIWNIEGNRVYTVAGNQQRTLSFDALILCTGATDRLMPLKGWNYAGTFSLGGSQIALKSQACAIGSEIVFCGTGALLYLVASQYVAAGANVAAVLDTSSFWGRVKALPKLLARPKALWNGMIMTAALKRAGVKVAAGVELLEIEGSAETGVSGIRYRTSTGSVEQQQSCDAVAMGYHLRPETQLADLARCEFAFDDATRQWLPSIDSDGRSTVKGVYLAGDGSRILGADAAEASGRLAALAAIQDLGFGGSDDQAELNALRAELDTLQRFARGLSEAFPWPAEQAAKLCDDTVVCRCEVITAGELRRHIRETGAEEANRAKSFSRVGMGRCQGRYCGNAAAEIIAAATQVPVQEVGRLRGQAPVKPFPIAVEESSE